MHFGMEVIVLTSSSLEAECERPQWACLRTPGATAATQAGAEQMGEIEPWPLSFIHLFIQQIPLLTSASTGPEAWVDKGPYSSKLILQ